PECCILACPERGLKPATTVQPSRKGFLIPRYRRIYKNRPGLDAPAHASGIGESMSAQIGRGIKTAHSMMANRHNRRIFGPSLHDFLGKTLIHEEASLHSRDRVLLRCADIY